MAMMRRHNSWPWRGKLSSFRRSVPLLIPEFQNQWYSTTNHTMIGGQICLKIWTEVWLQICSVILTAYRLHIVWQIELRHVGAYQNIYVTVCPTMYHHRPQHGPPEATRHWPTEPLMPSDAVGVSISPSLSIYLSLSIFLSPSIYLSLSIYLSIYLSIQLSIHLSLHLPICLSNCLSIYLSISLSLSLYLSIHPSIYLSLSLSLQDPPNRGGRRHPGASPFLLHYTTLHYTTLHSTTPDYTTLHYITLNDTAPQIDR